MLREKGTFIRLKSRSCYITLGTIEAPMPYARPNRNGPTIKDIAAALGVSHVTVSRALNDSPLVTEETKKRLREAAASMGYIPDAAAKQLRGGRSNIVGFILPDVENHFFSAIARVIAETLAASGMQLVLSISEDDPDLELRHVRSLCEARPKGIIITPVVNMHRETADLLANIPCKQLVRRHPLVESDVIVSEDKTATRLAAQRLIDLGHRHIAYIGNGSETLSTGADRAEGFYQAVWAAPEVKATIKLGPPGPGHGYETAIELLTDPKRPTAIVLGSALFTIGTLQAIRETGLEVPRDISLIGYDDPDWFKVWGAGITTVALPIREMAMMAASLVGESALEPALEPAITSIDGTSCKRLTFPVNLVQRGSDRQFRDRNQEV
ncbi:LacI family DNA-binding transcriptional regulator [Pseudohoeflea coraliihabitans]|uniref:LacI family transcriptional regulator n=1 Tax=Pseudohoeflea coraliihabitans TaxID=2860393 RepID=A0ABS6WMI2_9HYPH|nr:LacI family DNA-binding transcriptional regulator [Pseudohoeflea sp. DP4N28-3]MBW3097153.1 LacI family transcriptional regulator [Pseudohoeflea sp. DP4N28-3]